MFSKHTERGEFVFTLCPVINLAMVAFIRLHPHASAGVVVEHNKGQIVPVGNFGDMVLEGHFDQADQHVMVGYIENSLRCHAVGVVPCLTVDTRSPHWHLPQQMVECDIAPSWFRNQVHGFHYGVGRTTCDQETGKDFYFRDYIGVASLFKPDGFKGTVTPEHLELMRKYVRTHEKEPR